MDRSSHRSPFCSRVRTAIAAVRFFSVQAARTAAFAVSVAGMLALCAVACDCPADDVGRITLVSYNLQTLFDPVDDGGEYAEFSVAKGRYGDKRYRGRLSALARVLEAAVPGGPDILVVQELENGRVLADLGDALGSYPYRACAEDGKTVLECGLLSRYPIRSFKTHRLELPNGEFGPQRLMLEARLDLNGRELTVLAAHWKSKLEGGERTEPARVAAAAMAYSLIGRILERDPRASVLLAGDLNENPDEDAQAPYAAALPGVLGLCADREVAARSAGGDRPLLYSPWDDYGGFSYSYGGREERIDHLALSPGLAGAGSMILERFWAAAPAFALDAEGKPLGYRPSDGGGFSDHLPVCASFLLSP